MFSKRLRELRDSHNLSMDKLVELYNKRFNAKMNKSTLSRYENGTQDPIYTVVVNLAKLFTFTQGGYFNIDDSSWTPAKNLKNWGM